MNSATLPRKYENRVMFVIGEIIDTIPNTKLVETTVEPNKFPAINSAFEFLAEKAEKNTSGRAVPSPTIKTPIITSGISSSEAKNTADFTIPCAATIRRKVPMTKFLRLLMNKINLCQICRGFSCGEIGSGSK